jgi:hypothetical protein
MKQAEFDALCGEVGEQVGIAIEQWIVNASDRTGESRAIMATVAGKALIGEGCLLLGHVIGIEDPEIGLAPGEECLRKYKELAEQGAKQMEGLDG